MISFGRLSIKNSSNLLSAFLIALTKTPEFKFSVSE